ncbi:MAG: primosomal protein N', partial [Alistipes sp.]|nr:primosomal protein N' [Alistipes sp.]
MLYADIVLPLAQPAYTFAVPDGTQVAEGQAVAVQFGPRKFYTGIVWRVHDRRPDFKRIKSMHRVLYDRPLLSERQRALWEWIAAYYLCSVGEVMRCALPSLIKPSADSEEEFFKEAYRPRTE